MRGFFLYSSAMILSTVATDQAIASVITFEASGELDDLFGETPYESGTEFKVSLTIAPSSGTHSYFYQSIPSDYWPGEFRADDLYNLSNVKVNLQIGEDDLSFIGQTRIEYNVLRDHSDVEDTWITIDATNPLNGASFFIYSDYSAILGDDMPALLATGFNKPVYYSQFGYEDDSHDELLHGTLSRLTSTGLVPEPFSWTLMVAGFGLVGGAMRSRRRHSVSFA